MNLIKSLSGLFGKKSKASGEAVNSDEKVSKSVELNVPNSKVKRRKQKRGY